MSFGTGSTLAEDVEAEEAALKETVINEKGKEKKVESDKEKENEKVEEEPIKLKRFSATHRDLQGDAMITVDENITEKSDKISKKVMEIQQKVGIPLFEPTFLYTILC
jgi:tRNA(Ile)-lysidine synthase TilS/MesJ